MSCTIREIENSDYNKGYIELLQKFANFTAEITEKYFTDFLQRRPF